MRPALVVRGSPAPRPYVASHLTPAGALLLAALLALTVVVSGLVAAYQLGRRDAERDGFVEGAFAAGRQVVEEAGKLESLVQSTRAKLRAPRLRPSVSHPPAQVVRDTTDSS